MNIQNITNLDEASLKRTRIAVFLFYFCQGICFSSWAGRIADIKTSMQLDDAAWGTLLLMIPLGQICGMTISGPLISKMGSKRIFPIAIIGYALTLLLIGVSNTQYALIMSLVAFGFFGNFSNISVNTQGMTVEAMYQRPIIATFHGAWSLAGLVGAGISLIMTTTGVSPIYHYCLIAVLVLITFFTNRKYLLPDPKKELTPEDIANKKNKKPETFLYLIGIVAFFGMAAEGAITDWSGLYLTDIVGTAEKYAPLGLFAYMLTMAGGRFFIDKASEEWGQKKVIQTCGILIAAGLTLAISFPNLIVTIIAFMLIGFGTSGVAPIVYSIAGQRTRISTSMALTIVTSISFLGFLLGPPVIGYISHATNLRISYALIAVFGLCITLMVSKIKVFRTNTFEKRK